jgi:cell pole-organizing protein PopZ
VHAVDRGAEAAKAGVPAPPGHSPQNSRAAEPAEVKGAAQGDVPATRALESAVLELLKPMIAQWLDRNMPRLVAEALKEEAARTRAEGGAKKAQ